MADLWDKTVHSDTTQFGRGGRKGTKIYCRDAKSSTEQHKEYRDIHEHKMIKVLALIKTECYLLMVRT